MLVRVIRSPNMRRPPRDLIKRESKAFLSLVISTLSATRNTGALRVLNILIHFPSSVHHRVTVSFAD